MFFFFRQKTADEMRISDWSSDVCSSDLILWGPPGTGKTSIARLLADATDLQFAPLSAVFSGVADLRKVFDEARKRRATGQATLLFVDEIHRFNRAQQDGFLPYVEEIGRASCRESVCQYG